jgi:glycosyltransferase involved in cell wall biosynthesis
VAVINDATVGEEPEILAAAYALIQPYTSNNLLFLFDAMQCHVPVLIENNASFKEITSDAVLYFDSKSEMDIADKLMLIYKDETLRNKLIEKGKNLIEDYNWEKATEAVAKTFNN